MFNGAGRYDDECTIARESAHADGAVLMIFGGDRGPGFSVQAPLPLLLTLPAALRHMADEIDQQIRDRLAEGGE